LSKGVKLEALALDEFRQGHLGRVEPRRLLGFATRAKLDGFVTGLGVFGTTRQTIWSATAATCSASASDPACRSSLRMPGRCLISLWPSRPNWCFMDDREGVGIARAAALPSSARWACSILRPAAAGSMCQQRSSVSKGDDLLFPAGTARCVVGAASHQARRRAIMSGGERS
jgi:hypothetical protein